MIKVAQNEQPFLFSTNLVWNINQSAYIWS